MEQMISAAFVQILLELSVIFALMIILIPAALVDYKERRIPNILSMSGWFLGPLLNFAISGIHGIQVSLLGFIVLFALTFPFWLLGWMGAGDVKLMAGVGALTGVDNVWLIALCVAVVGLFMALVMLALKGVLGDSYDRYKAMMGLSVVANKPVYIESGHGEEKKTMPYAVPIAFGTFIALLIRYSS